MSMEPSDVQGGQEGGAGAMPAARPTEPTVSLIELATILLRRKRLVLAFVGTGLFLATAWALLSPKRWTADAAFITQNGETPRSRLASLAGQFGVDVGDPMTTRTPEFYTDLLRSRTVLTRVADDSIPTADGGFATLADLLEVEARNPAARRTAVRQWLRQEAISVETLSETGIVRVRVTTPWPSISARTANRVLEEVNKFNVEARNSEAAAERRFVEERLRQSQQELRTAENDLQEFLWENRRFENSPDLKFQHDRLARRVATLQEVYTSLQQSYEQARISEVRNIPVITVLDEAEIPVAPDSRGVPTKVALAVFLSLITGVAVAIVVEYGARQRGGEKHREFAKAWAEVRSGFRRGS